MADRQVGLRIMLEHQHFVQIAPINEADAKQIMETIERGWTRPEDRVVVVGHSFTEDGQPWKYSIPVNRVVGMHTFAMEQQVRGFTQNQPALGHKGFTPQFGRS